MDDSFNRYVIKQVQYGDILMTEFNVLFTVQFHNLFRLV